MRENKQKCGNFTLYNCGKLGRSVDAREMTQSNMPAYVIKDLNDLAYNTGCRLIFTKLFKCT